MWLCNIRGLEGGLSLRLRFFRSVGVYYHCQISSLCVLEGPQRKVLGSPGLYHRPATDDVDLLEVMIQEATKTIVVKGSSEVMSAEELFGGLEKVMQKA